MGKEAPEHTTPGLSADFYGRGPDGRRFSPRRGNLPLRRGQSPEDALQGAIDEALKDGAGSDPLIARRLYGFGESVVDFRRIRNGKFRRQR